jgi:hypothetical protein
MFLVGMREIYKKKRRRKLFQEREMEKESNKKKNVCTSEYVGSH